MQEKRSYYIMWNLTSVFRHVVHTDLFWTRVLFQVLQPPWCLQSQKLALHHSKTRVPSPNLRKVNSSYIHFSDDVKKVLIDHWVSHLKYLMTLCCTTLILCRCMLFVYLYTDVSLVIHCCVFDQHLSEIRHQNNLRPVGQAWTPGFLKRILQNVCFGQILFENEFIHG